MGLQVEGQRGAKKRGKVTISEVKKKIDNRSKVLELQMCKNMGFKEITERIWHK